MKDESSFCFWAQSSSLHSDRESSEAEIMHDDKKCTESFEELRMEIVPTLQH